VAITYYVSALQHPPGPCTIAKKHSGKKKLISTKIQLSIVRAIDLDSSLEYAVYSHSIALIVYSITRPICTPTSVRTSLSCSDSPMS
jgi:hypothetical protein